MKNRGFPLPMERAERTAGWIWLPVHIFALKYLVSLLVKLLNANGVAITDPYANVIYYGISFVFVLVLMFRYLRRTFGDLWDHKMDSLEAIVIGYVFYYALCCLVAMVLDLLDSGSFDPNSAFAIQQTKLNADVMVVISVLLAPIVEEVLFRGVAFGTLRVKNAFPAYLVSVLLFAVYHMWPYLLDGYGWSVLLYMLRYVPGGIALAWCYDKSKNLWAPILLHAAINYITLTVSLG